MTTFFAALLHIHRSTGHIRDFPVVPQALLPMKETDFAPIYISHNSDIIS